MLQVLEESSSKVIVSIHQGTLTLRCTLSPIQVYEDHLRCGSLKLRYPQLAQIWARGWREIYLDNPMIVYLMIEGMTPNSFPSVLRHSSISIPGWMSDLSTTTNVK